MQWPTRLGHVVQEYLLLGLSRLVHLILDVGKVRIRGKSKFPAGLLEPMCIEYVYPERAFAETFRARER